MEDFVSTLNTTWHVDSSCALLQIAPPAASGILSKPAPLQPVVLRMSVLIDYASNIPAESPSLGQLSISDQSNEMAQLRNSELPGLLQADSQSGGEVVSDAAAASIRATEAKLKRAEGTAAGGLSDSQAKLAKANTDNEIVAMTYVRLWTDQDSQQLWK